MADLILCVDLDMINFYEQVKCKHYEGDCGFDLCCSEDTMVEPNSMETINTGVRGEALQSNINISYLLVPRSSIYKTRLILMNSVGVINSGYRGYISAHVYNIGNDVVTINKGMRLFQLIPMNGFGWNKIILTMDFEKLSKSERGDNGFGSTGK